MITRDNSEKKLRELISQRESLEAEIKAIKNNTRLLPEKTSSLDCLAGKDDPLLHNSSASYDGMAITKCVSSTAKTSRNMRKAYSPYAVDTDLDITSPGVMMNSPNVRLYPSTLMDQVVMSACHTSGAHNVNLFWYQDRDHFPTTGTHDGPQLQQKYLSESVLPVAVTNQKAELQGCLDVQDYLAQIGFSPISPQPTRTAYRVDADESMYCNVLLPTAAPSLTYAPTIDDTTMSRSPSLFDGRLDMLKNDSNMSSVEDHERHKLNALATAVRRNSGYSDEQSHLLTGAGGVGGYFTNAYDIETLMPAILSKSDSAQSMKSNSSRNRERLETLNKEAATRVIKPKSANTIPIAEPTQSEITSRSEAEMGIANIPKFPQPRRKHEQVRCFQCQDLPTFRGDHELRRHQDREHQRLVKKWVVIEPNSEGREVPILPLANCKACGMFQKKYGAYYNVAAHLRRAHFKPKKSKKHKINKEAQEKRGGKAGGKWPPMSELRHWMTQIEVEVSAQASEGGFEDEGIPSDDRKDLRNIKPLHDTHAEISHPMLPYEVDTNIMNDDSEIYHMCSSHGTSFHDHIDGTEYSYSFPSSIQDVLAPDSDVRTLGLPFTFT